MELLEVLFRGFISLIVLFAAAKVLGKKQVAELSLFDYVIGISIGNFAAEITINMDVPLINGVVAVVLFGFVAYVISALTMKSILVRRFVTGTPTILVEKGKFIYKNMSKTKFDINDFLEECRGNGYFDINEIEYAILEANGKISFLPKAEYRPITPKDMKVNVSKSVLLANIIIDERLIIDNLANMGKTKDWLDKELKIKGYNDYHNLLLVTLDENEKIIVYEKNKDLKSKDILE